jgi:hypothetical protein
MADPLPAEIPRAEPVTVAASFVSDAGFTPSGLRHYESAVNDYAHELKDRSVAYAEAEKAPGLARETTYEHVRSAARHISASTHSNQTTPTIICRIGEYICAAVAGAGAGHLDKQLGILSFGVGLTLGVVLLLIRTRRSL